MVPSKNSFAGKHHRSPDAFNRAPIRIREAARETLSPIRETCLEERREDLRVLSGSLLSSISGLVLFFLSVLAADLGKRRVRGRLWWLSCFAASSGFRLGGDISQSLLVFANGVQGLLAFTDSLLSVLTSTCLSFAFCFSGRHLFSVTSALVSPAQSSCQKSKKNVVDHKQVTWTW